MSGFLNEVNLYGNKLLNVRFENISSPDIPPSDEFGKVVYYDGTGVYAQFTDGAGFYHNIGNPVWERIINEADVDVTATINSIVRRDSNGNINVALTPTAAAHTVSLSYLNTILASGVRIVGTITQTGPSHYPKGNAAAFVGGVQTGNGTLAGNNVAKGNAWRIATGGYLMGQPTGEIVQAGDLVIATTNSAGNNDVDWIIIQQNIIPATTTVDGSVMFAVAGDVATRGAAALVTSKVLTPELTELSFDNFVATTVESGTTMLATLADFATRVAAGAVTTKTSTPAGVLESFNNFISNTAEAGTALLATSADVSTMAAATLVLDEIVAPNRWVDVFNNWNATTIAWGTVTLAEAADVVSLATLGANATDAMTPALVKQAFDNVHATNILYGTVKKYSASNISSIANANVDDSNFLTPLGFYTLMNNIGALISAQYSLTGLSGVVVVSNAQVADIREITVYDSTGDYMFISIDAVTNSGINVNIAWSTTSAITGTMNVVHI